MKNCPAVAWSWSMWINWKWCDLTLTLQMHDTTFEWSEFEVVRHKATCLSASNSRRSIQDKVAVVPAASRVSKLYALSHFPVTATEESGQWHWDLCWKAGCFDSVRQLTVLRLRPMQTVDETFRWSVWCVCGWLASRIPAGTYWTPGWAACYLQRKQFASLLEFFAWHIWRAPWKNRTSPYISFFPPITQWCYISDVPFTGGRWKCQILVF